MLVPELAGGAAGELAGLRDACDEAVRELASTSGSVLVLGTAERASTHCLTADQATADQATADRAATDRGRPQAGWGPVVFGPDATGSLAGFGVPFTAGAPGPPVLPLSLTIGAWLLDRAGAPTARRRYLQVDTAAGAGTINARDVNAPDSNAPDSNAPDSNAPDINAAGINVVELTGVTGLLVMGDGPARLDPKAPGAFDERAAGYADTVADLLARGEADGLAGLDRELGDQLLAAGVPAWRVAGMIVRDQVRTTTAGKSAGVIRARLTARAAPYGVDYLVASWELPWPPTDPAA